MTPEDKDLMFRELCARLPYGVICKTFLNEKSKGFNVPLKPSHISKFMHGTLSIVPFLRSMSSMTEEEKRELQSYYPGCFGDQWLDTEKGTIELFECGSTITLYLNDSERIVDWLNKHHFDYRGLIEKGLVLEAPEGMYNK